MIDAEVDREQADVAELRRSANFRDLGNLPAQSGRRLRPGVLLRSGRLSDSSAGALRYLTTLELKTICDLRTAAERTGHPTPTLPNSPDILEFVRRDDLRSDVRLGDILLRNPTARGAAAVMTEIYRRFPQYFAPTLRNLVLRLLDGGSPLLIHCTAGKDRTGFVVAFLLRLLGVTEAAAEADYLASRNWSGANRLRLEVASRFEAVPAAALPAVLDVLLGVEVQYLAIAWRSLECDFGSFDHYLENGLGINTAQRRALQASLLW